MRRIAAVVLGMAVVCAPAPAQDIVGVEDCTKTSGLDRRTSCLQSNVNFLQRLLARNAVDAQKRLAVAASEAAALRTEAAALRTEVTSLKAVVAELRAKLEALQAAAKPSDASKAPDQNKDGK